MLKNTHTRWDQAPTREEVENFHQSAMLRAKLPEASLSGNDSRAQVPQQRPAGWYGPEAGDPAAGTSQFQRTTR